MKKTRIKLFLVVSSLFVFLMGCSVLNQAFILTVKDGNFYDYPDQTVGEAFDDFFSSPEWEYFLSTDDEHIVEFNGDADFAGETVTVTIQFLVEEDSEEFEIIWFGVDDISESDALLFDLLDTVFGY